MAAVAHSVPSVLWLECQPEAQLCGEARLVAVEAFGGHESIVWEWEKGLVDGVPFCGWHVHLGGVMRGLAEARGAQLTRVSGMQ